jgi:hypothetical protein
MKSSLLLLAACFAVELQAWAQPGPPPGGSNRMEALRIAFLTEELDLTPDESKAFWPLQLAFDDSMDAQREAMKERRQDFQADKASDEELRSFVNELAAQRKSMVDLESAHLLQVADLLGAERALRLPELQRDLARRLRERMGSMERQGTPGPRQGMSVPATRRSRLH